MYCKLLYFESIRTFVSECYDCHKFTLWIELEICLSFSSFYTSYHPFSLPIYLFPAAIACSAHVPITPDSNPSLQMMDSFTFSPRPNSWLVSHQPECVCAPRWSAGVNSQTLRSIATALASDFCARSCCQLASPYVRREASASFASSVMSESSSWKTFISLAAFSCAAAVCLFYSVGREGSKEALCWFMPISFPAFLSLIYLTSAAKRQHAILGRNWRVLYLKHKLFLLERIFAFKCLCLVLLGLALCKDSDRCMASNSMKTCIERVELKDTRTCFGLLINAQM